MPRIAVCAIAFSLFLVLPSLARGDDPADYTAYPDAVSTTTHETTIGGATLRYEATAGTMVLVDNERKPTARMFYVAYRRLPAAGADRLDAAQRPITFCFNGGPGSSSVWLHLGAFGPRRVDFADAMGNPGPPPFKLTDNESSLLDITDLVFIDPVSTGYSRTEEGTRASTFHGVEPDIDSVAEFIRRFLTREERWGSPKFIAGESYGTTRAAGLAATLWNDHGVALNGVILVSAVLDFQTTGFAPGNDLPYMLFMPTYAATAHYHEALRGAKRDETLADHLAAAEAFATGDYNATLMKGDAIEAGERTTIASRLGVLVGLDPTFVERSRLRIGMGAFAKELLRDRSRTVGRLDSRFTGIDREDSGDRAEFDPSYEAIRGNFSACLNMYMRGELEFRSDLPYEILTGVGPWDYGSAGNNRYLNVAERLRRAMHQQPYMRVFVASGVYDLATPYFATVYTVDHMGLAPERRANIELHRYEAGHMMYIDARERARLRSDLGAFFARSIESGTDGAAEAANP
ncbi:MAG: hypothetical protein KDA22_09525 [Phycisphaerales bacterium]|nr:hypothetical protein [Phycisphaerales bacterium]